MAARKVTPTRNGASRDALSVRVDNLAEDIHSVRTEIRDIRISISAEIASLASKLDERGRPQYGVLIALCSFLLLFMTTIGGFAYQSLSTPTIDMKAAIIALADRAVLQKQYDSDTRREDAEISALRKQVEDHVGTSIQQQRYNADKGARDGEITILRERFDKMLTRSEFDSQHGDLKNFISSMMSGRDRQIAELMSRILRLETEAMKH